MTAPTRRTQPRPQPRPPLSDTVLRKAALMRCDGAGYAAIAQELGLNGREAAHSAVVRAVNHGFVNRADLPAPATGSGGRGTGQGASRKPEYIVPRTVRPDWQVNAACLGGDPEMFFPVGGDDWSSKVDKPRAAAAKRICSSCPVQRECQLATPLGDTSSIRYGLTPPERRAHRRNRSSA